MKKILNLVDELFAFESSLFIYSLSFSILLALTPTLIISVMLFGFTELKVDMIVQAITTVIPTSVMSHDTISDLITSFITEGNIWTTLPTLVVSLWLGSRSVYSFMMIAARQERVDVPKWALRIKAVISFAAILLAIVFSILLIVRIPFFGTQFLNMPTRYLVLGISILALYYLFRSISCKKRPWTYGIIGSLFATTGISIATLIIKIIIFDHFGRYRNLYGSLAILVVLFLFVYVIAYIIYVGYLMNIVFTKDYGKEHLLDLKMPWFFNWAINISGELGNWVLRKGLGHEDNNKKDGD